MRPLLSRLAAIAVCTGAATLPACQPVDAPPPATQEPGAPTGAASPLGAPVRGVPATLAEARALGEEAAVRWQTGAVLAEVAVRLDGERWERAVLTYVAADADRILVVRVDGTGATQERVTLDTLELEPVSAEGAGQIPALPDGTLEPAALADAAGDALEACDARGAVTQVLYATGAPVAWDGDSWTQPPAWRATLLTEDRGGVVDPLSGVAAGPCVSPD